MKEERVIQKLLELGFKDDSSVNNPRFSLDINGFDLLYEKRKFTLEGNGGYEYNGTLELNHLQINDIKPLYKLLTGNVLKEIHASFNYLEWQEKLRKQEEEREENYKRMFPEGTFERFPKFKDTGFLDMLKKGLSKEPSMKFEWSERTSINTDDTNKLPNL